MNSPNTELRTPNTPAGRRIAVPTSNFAWAALPLVLFAALSLWLSFAAVVWKSYVAFIVVLCGLDFTLRPRKRTVLVGRLIEEQYHVGYAASYRLKVENTGSTTLKARLRELLPGALQPNEHLYSFWLEPGESASLTVRFVPKARGRFPLPATTLRIRHPLALLAYQETLAEGKDEIVVYPGRPAAETSVLIARARVLDEAGARVVRRRGHDSDFESLRDYVVGDDLRFIDWKATARRAQPQVRQFQMERNAEVILALDCGRLMGNLVRGVSKLDLAITPVLDLAAVAIQRGERVGLIAFDSRVLAYVPPRGGIRQIGLITQTLAGLDTGFEQTSFTRAVGHLQVHHKKRSLVVVFTDFTDEISSRDLQLVLTALSRRHVLLFVAVGDPHLDDILEETPATASAAFQKGVAAELTLERRRVIHSMNRAGVLALDADPFRMTARLINRYLEARSRL